MTYVYAVFINCYNLVLQTYFNDLLTDCITISNTQVIDCIV